MDPPPPLLPPPSPSQPSLPPQQQEQEQQIILHLSPSLCCIVQLPLSTTTNGLRVEEFKRLLFSQVFANVPPSSSPSPPPPLGPTTSIIWSTFNLVLSSAPSSSSSSSPLFDKKERRWEIASLNYDSRAHPEDVAKLLARGPDQYVLVDKGNSNALIEDDRDVIQEASAAAALTEWSLIPAHECPPPPFRIRIVGTRTRMDAFGKEYNAFDILVRNGKLEWSLSKRYSDFVTLHGKMLKDETMQQQQQHQQPDAPPLPPLPSLPSKHLPLFFSQAAERQLQERQEKLEIYLAELVRWPLAMENIHILSFLGIMSSMRAEFSSSVEGTVAASGGGGSAADKEKMKKRQVIHVSALGTSLDVGDIILFKCAHSLAKLQRGVTGAEWDHVAMVVERRTNRSILSLLESTADGVTAYPLFARISAYATEFTSYMAIRKLEGERSPLMRKRLQDFVARVEGKPYGFSVNKLFARKHHRPTPAAAAAAGETGQQSSITADSSCPPSSSSSSSSIPVGGFLSRIRAGLPLSLPLPLPLSTSWGKKEGTNDAPQKDATTNANTTTNTKAAEEAGFFCSNLVAAALQEAGVLRPEINVDYFWPGSFQVSGEIDGENVLVEGFRFGEVILLDTKQLEVGRASVISGDKR